MKEKRILVAYATNSGSTEKVARIIGEEFRKDGAAADVRRVEEVKDLSPYTTAIVGGPMIMGWHRAALKFLRRYRSQLSRMPVAYFFTARSLTQLNETEVLGVPVSIDPTLAQLPKDPAHLSFRENYATVKNYLRPALNAAHSVKPVSAAFFGGVLRMSNLKWWQTIFVLLIVQAKPGGEHNEAFIQEWVRNIQNRI
jgi:menaquinone-dependent protoporphyrinogen IX oxidase